MLKTSHENTLLQSQLEIQEQTFQHIAREIHDNIGQRLTLAKLYLNSFDFGNPGLARQQVTDSVNIIGQSINDLSDLSRSMSSEIILNNGFIKAIESETARLAKTGIYQITLSVTGNPVFMNSNTELVLFRIAQEALHNIVKHAKATTIGINLNYAERLLTMQVFDNGCGFNIAEKITGTGIQNIKKRTSMLHGRLIIDSTSRGTTIKIEIPLNENIKEF